MKNLFDSIFYPLAALGFVDMAIQAATSGEVKLIHKFLELFF